MLPTSCVLARMVMSSAEQDVIKYPFQIEEYNLFKGVTFSTFDEEKTLHSEILKNDNNAQVKLFSTKEKKLRAYHYKAAINFKPDVFREKYHDLELNKLNAIKRHEIYSEFLFHEGVLQGIREVLYCNDKKMSLLCRVSSEDMEESLGVFSESITNPIIDDLVLQALILWPRLVNGISALPSLFKQWLYLQPVPLDVDFYIGLEVKNITSLKFTANIIVSDEDGNIYMDIDTAEATLSFQLNEQFNKKVY